MNDVEVVKEQGRALTAAEFYKLAEVPPEIGSAILVMLHFW